MSKRTTAKYSFDPKVNNKLGGESVFEKTWDVYKRMWGAAVYKGKIGVFFFLHIVAALMFMSLLDSMGVL